MKCCFRAATHWSHKRASYLLNWSYSWLCSTWCVAVNWTQSLPRAVHESPYALSYPSNPVTTGVQHQFITRVVNSLKNIAIYTFRAEWAITRWFLGWRTGSVGSCHWKMYLVPGPLTIHSLFPMWDKSSSWVFVTLFACFGLFCYVLPTTRFHLTIVSETLKSRDHGLRPLKLWDHFII